MMRERLLTADDAGALEAFLRQHRDGSMLLRSNLSRVGIGYTGARFQAHYFAAMQGDAVVAVAAHNFNGMLLLQAPEGVEALVLGAVAMSGRAVTGFIGPAEQVRRARTALGLDEAAVRRAGQEGLYALELSELFVPAALARGELQARPPRSQDLDTLYEWRVAYDVEVLGAARAAELRANAVGFIDWQVDEGNAYVATRGNTLLGYSGFNARVSDMVQLGGIYTPPALRGRGYARAAIAGELLFERERGVTRAVLFTDDEDPKPVHCYEALGFRRVADFGFVLLS